MSLLTSEKIFGEHSLNITNLAEVQYTVKFPSGSPGRTSFEMSDFLDFKYEKLQDLSKTVESLSCRFRKKSKPIQIKSRIFKIKACLSVEFPFLYFLEYL